MPWTCSATLPVKLVTAPHTPVPFGPSPERIARAARSIT
jgi:hypothetical protein